MRVLSSELSAHAGESVTMAGWLHAKRELGSVTLQKSPALALSDQVSHG